MFSIIGFRILGALIANYKFKKENYFKIILHLYWIFNKFHSRCC
jgi:NADH/NAD ratio-sensing transcriptional regulator Rex